MSLIAEEVSKSVENYEREMNELSFERIENLSLRDIREIRNRHFYKSIDDYILACESEKYDMNDLGEFVFLLTEELSSIYFKYVS